MRHKVATAETENPNKLRKAIVSGVAAMGLGATLMSGAACEPVPVDPSETTTTTAPPDNGISWMGDSITVLQGGAIVEAFPGADIYATPGWRMDQIQPYLDDVIADGDQFLVYNAGTNDAMQDLDPAIPYQAFISSVENPAANLDCVVLTTVSQITAEYPTNYQGAPEQYNPNSAATMNALIAETVANQDDQPPFYTVADWNAVVTGPDGESYLAMGERNDRIHENVAGAYKLTEIQGAALEACPAYNG